MAPEYASIANMAHKLAYSGTPLDRAAALRGDEAWLSDQAKKDPLVLAVRRELNLIIHAETGRDNPDAAILSGQRARDVLRHKNPLSEAIFLGLQDNIPVFAVDFSDMEEQQAVQFLDGGGAGNISFADLRSVGQIMDRHTGSMLAFARGMAYWHRRHQFCGVCGSPTRSGSGGFVRTCTSESCGIDHFPRTDPAVIMLVTATLDGGDHCLLGRQSSWAAGHYSALAGFVEPGESLESAVAREVREEASIDVTDVVYTASQPWPFPSSLMLGFRARATTFDIDAGEDELEDARWFSRAELRERARQDATDGKLSRSDSIARWLIEQWMDEADA